MRAAELRFTVHVAPVVKARPRTVTRGKGGRALPFARTFTPKHTQVFEALVADAARTHITDLRETFDEDWDTSPGDFELTVIVHRQKRVGDLDNYVKAISDALNGIAFVDDKYIMAEKSRMHHDRENPRVEVRVRRWELGEYTMKDWNG